MGAGNATGFQDTPGAAAAGGYGTYASAAAGYGSQAGYGADQAAGYGDPSQGADAAAYAAQAGQAGKLPSIRMCHLLCGAMLISRYVT